jgi:hypothetical protein
VNPIYSLIELRQSHHYYHHFSILMRLLVYDYLVYFIATALTITFLYLLSCKAISHTRIVALFLFPRWYKHLVCVELYQRLIELERTFILPLAPRWVRHSYLSKRLHMIPYTCGLSVDSLFWWVWLRLSVWKSKFRLAGTGVGGVSIASLLWASPWRVSFDDCALLLLCWGRWMLR